MTTQEIYNQANETTTKELNNLLAGFNSDENNTFNSLVSFGDSKELALWTVIAKRYTSVDSSDIYSQAYYS